MTREAPSVSPARKALEDGVVTIDIVSDVVCPWCYVGKRRIEAAIAGSGGPVEIHWRPFQLDSTIPPGGLDRRTYLAGKFGDDGAIEAIHRRLALIGDEVGLAFAFDRIARAPNTLDAHRLIRWSASTDVQDVVVEALFRAYFQEGRDIGDRKVLVEVAEACGMNPGLVHRLLVSDSDDRDVREEIATAARLGVTGVPFFIFAGRYGVPGARSVEELAAAILKAREDAPARPAD